MLIPLLTIFLVVPSVGPARSPHPNPVVRHERTACEAVTRAGVQQVLGRAVGAGIETAQSTVESTCEFATREGRITVSLHHLQSKPDMDSELANLQKAIPGAAVRCLQGFGDNARAWVLDLGEAGVQIHLIHSERNYVMVSVLGLGDAGLVTGSAQAISRQVLATLHEER